ncbi:MAG: DUF547 domain-containing protein [Opitutaceae bacterium]
MKPFRVLTFVALSSLARGAATPDDALYTAVLQQHVRAGLVDYAALKNDSRLDTYLAQIAAMHPETLEQPAARLAFWINAYNAYTLKLVAEHYPIKSIRDLSTGGHYIGQLVGKTAWDIRFADVGGKKFTLDEIEHQVLRPQFKDPRLHFAIVCAARSCPILRNEAYTPQRLEEQLGLQGRWFMSWRNQFDLATRQARLSPIFEWFGEDFGANQAEMLSFLADYLSVEVAASLRAAPDKWKVTYVVYDWSLNSREPTP